MRVKSVDDTERLVLSAMIRSSEFLKRIRPIWKADFFLSSGAGLLSSWVVRYFDEYKKAPGLDVKTFVHSEEYQRLPEEEQAWVSKLIVAASKDVEPVDFNVEYHVDVTVKYFKKRDLVLLAEEVRHLVDAGELHQAESRVSGWKPTHDGRSNGAYLFSDPKVLSKALSRKDKSFNLFGGRLGEEVNPYLGRDAFFAFMAPEKRGKSMWLMEVAVRASRKRLRVAMFQLGDMSEEQVIARFIIRIAGKNNDPRYCVERWKPVSDCRYNQDGTCDKSPCAEEGLEPLWSGSEEVPDLIKIDNSFDPNRLFQMWTPDWVVCKDKRCPRRRMALWYEKVPPTSPLTFREAYQAAQSWTKRYGPIRLSVHSAGTLSVADSVAILDSWESEDGFVPDVIIYDYPDIMAPEPHSRNKERRHQENDRWQALRSLSTERHACVVVATQTSASAYGRRKISLSDYSEDKRKFAHVTAMFAINQTPTEKKLRMFRISPVLVRDGEGDSSLEIPVLYSPEVYQACLATE